VLHHFVLRPPYTPNCHRQFGQAFNWNLHQQILVAMQQRSRLNRHAHDLNRNSDPNNAEIPMAGHRTSRKIVKSESADLWDIAHGGVCDQSNCSWYYCVINTKRSRTGSVGTWRLQSEKFSRRAGRLIPTARSRGDSLGRSRLRRGTLASALFKQGK